MPLAPLLLALLAPATASSSEPINVTGHAWAPFISPMGEPFRAKTTSDDTLANWFRQADVNHDGALTADEMQADAARFFALLDTIPDGEIDPDEIARYEYEVAPEIQVMSRTRRPPGRPAAVLEKDVEDEKPRDRKRRRDREYASLGFGGSLQGAARYSLLNIPEPVAAADADFDRGVSLQEFKQAAFARFHLLDTAGQGRLGLAQLQALRPAPPLDGRPPKRNEPGDTRIGNPLPTGP